MTSNYFPVRVGVNCSIAKEYVEPLNAPGDVRFFLWDGVPGSYKDGINNNGNLWDGLDYRFTKEFNMDDFLFRPDDKCNYT